MQRLKHAGTGIALCVLALALSVSSCAGDADDVAVSARGVDTAMTTGFDVCGNVGIPPRVVLQEPVAEQVFLPPPTIAVVAEVSDDCSAPTELELVLHSSLDGVVGRPDVLDSGVMASEVFGLSRGNHNLTLTARNRRGLVGAATVSIRVN